MGATVIGLDCGLAAFGVAAVELGNGVEYVRELRVLRTKPSAKKERTFASDDTLRRAQEVYDGLSRILDAHRPIAIAAESMSFPRIGKQVMVKACQQLGVAWGIIASIASSRSLPVVQCSPQALKKAVAGATTASKEQVQAALVMRYQPFLFAELKKGDLEHAADALGAIVACLDSDVLRMARQMRAPERRDSWEGAGPRTSPEPAAAGEGGAHHGVAAGPAGTGYEESPLFNFPAEVRAAGGA